MSNQINNYDDSSIDQLLGAERIRRRPASLLGSGGLDGARHCFTEIYGNALDEASTGYGDKLEVKYYEDGSVSVRDYGRGVPIGWNEKRENWNWHIIYNDLYGGGKYDTNQEQLSAIRDWSTFDERQFNYLYSVGLNGLGAAATQYTSEYFIVESYRQGVCTRMRFEKGIPVINGEPIDLFNKKYDDITQFAPETEPTDQPDGTFIKWKPDSDVFSDINIGGDWLFEVCRDIAYVAHIDLTFEDEQRGIKEVIPADTLKSVITSRYDNKLLKDEEGNHITTELSAFDHGQITVEGKPFTWVCKLDIVMALAGSRNLKNHCYHNSVKMGGGVQYEGILDALRDFFTEKASKRGIKLEMSDYEDVFVFALSSYSNHASFRNQTKDAIDDWFIHDFVKKTVLNKLNMDYVKGNPEVNDAVERVMQEAENRVAIREAAKQIREAKKATKTKTPSKFCTCHAYMKKNYEAAELWIAEGDSALGALKKARNADFQAIFPIRGKCLNVMKSSMKKILKNAVIGDIFGLLGTGMDIGHGDLFDINNLKFGKIIFATDADEDGFQIRVLLFLIFYVLAPQILREGRVYIAETPRFELKLRNGESLYARDDAERDKYIAEHGSSIVAINRFKGLGEVDAGILRETTVHPDTRNLIPVTVDFEDEASRDIIDALFGADKYHQRKEILTKVLGAEVAEMLERNIMLMEEIDNSDIEEETVVEVVG